MTFEEILGARPALVMSLEDQEQKQNMVFLEFLEMCGLWTQNRERLPLAETERTARSLTEDGLPLGSLAVNRVAPPETTGLLAERAHREAEVRATIHERFREHGVTEVPLLPGALTGRDELADIAGILAEAGW